MLETNNKSKSKKVVTIVLIVIAVACLIGSILLNGTVEKTESIGETMREAVLHETEKVNFFGMSVNPSYISSCVVVVVLLILAACIRIFAIPHFKYKPGKFQMLIEMWVGFFDDTAKNYSPHRNKLLGPYIFAAGTFIFVGTIFELFGIQVVSTTGASIALPAPLSDINAAITLGCLSYIIILIGGIIGNGLGGVGNTLKEFSLPISMSFRLFGALLSGLLVTELVYYSLMLSFVVPILVAVLFTLLHALIQTYVLTLLTAMFYGEVGEMSEKKIAKKLAKKEKKEAMLAANTEHAA